MKKFLFLSAFIIALCTTGAQAQTRMTASADTNIDATTTTHTANLAGDLNTFETITIQAVGTKVSGTVAGTAILYGSIDGTTYHAIGADTLTLANVATNSKIWTLDKTRYKYYRVSVATTGTQKSVWKVWLLGRRLPR